MKKLRVGVVGMGTIAQWSHMPSYAKLTDEVEVVACADIDFEKAKTAAEKFGIKGVYSNIDDMIANEELDFVDVCTWTAAHAECVIKAANAGLDVICEKPFADNLENAAKMRDAVKKNGVCFMLAVPLRYDEKAMYVRQLVDEGAFGEVYYGKTAYVRDRGVPSGWFSCLKYSGGGPVLDIGVHRIDLAWYLMGNPKPYSVSATVSHHIGDYRESNTGGWPGSQVPDYEFGIEDSAHGFIRFENGASLYFEASWAFNGPNDNSTTISGDKLGCAIDKMTFYHNDGATVRTEVCDRKFDGDFYKNELKHFIDCINNGTTPCSDIEQAYELERVLMAIYESGKTGHEVILG